MWNDKTTPAPKFEFEIGDIAFMKSEATRGKMKPVKIIGVECLDTKNGQLLSYKIQNVKIEFKYEKLKRVSVLKKLIADATYTYNESALTSQDGASKLVKSYIIRSREQLETCERMHEAVTRVIAWPGAEMPVEEENGRVKYIENNKEEG